VRFGSLDIRLHARHQRYLDLLPRNFRVWPTPDDGTPPDLELVAGDGEERRPRAERTDDAMQIVAADREVRVSTGISELVLERHGMPRRACLVIHVAGQDPRFVEHYAVMHLQKLLQLLGRVRLHGAGVRLGQRTFVFLGDKGAGKSTLSLALGRAGGVVLADDQLVLRGDGAGVWVSGVDGGLRLTEATERHFFAEALGVEAQDFAGTLKKEVPLADHVATRPGVDHVPDVVLFTRVGDRLAVAELSRQVAVRRILDVLVPLHRFAGPEDQRDFLRLVTSFVNAVEVFELSLSPDLGDLDRLAARLPGANG
jgi:hypothetical protein